MSALWTEAEDNLIRRLSAEGVTGSAISRQLTGRSRTAVLARLWRKGWVREKSGPPKVASCKPLERIVVAPPVKRDLQAGAINARKGRPAPAAPMPPRLTLVEPAGAIRLMDRRRLQCAWPMGTPDRPANQMCCGEPVPEGANITVAAYCPRHADKAAARDLTRAPLAAKAYERTLRRFTG
jgi:hypothetical protein